MRRIGDGMAAFRTGGQAFRTLCPAFHTEFAGIIRAAFRTSPVSGVYIDRNGLFLPAVHTEFAGIIRAAFRTLPRIGIPGLINIIILRGLRVLIIILRVLLCAAHLI